MKIEYARLKMFGMRPNNSGLPSPTGTHVDSSKEPDDIFDFDALFHQSWKATTDRCKKDLENDELAVALQVKSLSDFIARLESQHGPGNESQLEVLYLLPFALTHYDTFATMFVKMMKRNVDVSLMWGLLYLVIKVSFRSIDSLTRVHKLLKAVGSHLGALNDITKNTPPQKILEDSILLHNKIMILWLNIISLFRDVPNKIQGKHWKPIEDSSDNIVEMIKETIDKCLQISKILLNTQKHKSLQLKLLQSNPQSLGDEVLLQSSNTLPGGKTTCHKIPASPNANFFGRESHIKDLKTKLQLDKEPLPTGLLSVALHGLGGMGKTQIAIEFAHRHTAIFPVILWFNGETEESMQESFNSAAVEWLGLPGAESNKDAENRMVLIKWLQETDIRWLLVYDNAEDTAIFNKYWPGMAKNGAAIITARKHTFNWGRESLEVGEFPPDIGLEFILFLLRDRVLSQADREAALELTQTLHGHPLSINLMVALMHNKMWSFRRFLRAYEANRERLLANLKPEWSHGGYNLTLGNLFSMSFGALSPNSHHMLGVLALISPDIITEDIFTVNPDLEIPETLRFCQDEDEFDDVTEELIALALIKRVPSNETINIHRLIQDEYKSQLDSTAWQKAFDAASVLLNEAFPKQDKGERFESRMPICARYIQHVYCLRDNLNTALNAKHKTGIVPSAEYVELMTNAAWYCAERQGLDELEIMLANAFRAMETNNMKETAPLSWAHLCNSAGRLWGHRGYFDQSERYLQQCLAIRKAHLGRGDQNVAGILSNLGNLNISMARYDTALSYLYQALDWGVVDGINRISIGFQSVIMKNTARAFTEKGCTKKAKEWYAKADGLYPSATKAPLNLFHKARVCLKDGNLEKARETLQEAHEWQTISNEGPTSLMIACCKYRLGSIALAQGETDAAIQYGTEALAIINLRQSPDAHKARVVYLMWRSKSQAGFEDPNEEQEFKELLEQAHEIRKALTGKGGYESDSEEAYDLLVDIQLR